MPTLMFVKWFEFFEFMYVLIKEVWWYLNVVGNFKSLGGTRGTTNKYLSNKLSISD